jgi:hypothetical protein
VYVYFKYERDCSQAGGNLYAISDKRLRDPATPVQGIYAHVRDEASIVRVRRIEGYKAHEAALDPGFRSVCVGSQLRRVGFQANTLGQASGKIAITPTEMRENRGGISAVALECYVIHCA